MKSLHTDSRKRIQRLKSQGLHGTGSSFRTWWSFLTLMFCLALSGISQAAADNLQSLPVSNSTSSVSCLVPEAGAPSCGIENSPGSAPITPKVPYHVGNPIDVVSGNKYQYELDYKSFSSGLTLARHYNSSLSIYDTGFGPGWRHTYQVLMTRVGEDQLTIVQSDGRLIRFFRTPASGNPDMFMPESAADGYLEFGKRSTWYMADGRRMVFQGSHLVLLDLGNHLGVLSLYYRDGKLHSVTDSHGDVLTFQYVPGGTQLPEYGSTDIVQPAGSIASVRLPDGNVIHYQYGAYRNLMGVQYPDEQATGYGYHDDDWPSHLTLRQSTAENRLSEWRYDPSGQAIAWIEGGGLNGLEIARDGLSPDSGSSETRGSGATVTYADGRESRYDWSGDQGGFFGDDQSFDITCDNCLPDQIPIDGNTVAGSKTTATRMNVTDSAASSGNTQRAETPLSTDPMDEAVAILWASLRRSVDDSPAQPGESTHEGLYPHEQGDVSFRLTTDRTGRIRQMVIGELILSQLARRSLTEALPPCYAGENPSNPETFSHDRIHALGTGAEPCQLDGLVAVELLQKLEEYSSPATDVGHPLSEMKSRKKEDVPWWSQMRRYCSLPPGKTCEELADDLNMALLSRCSYGTYSCEPTFTLVEPYEIDFSNDQFHLEGFDAQLYHDPARDRYIVVFRGTDGIGDDWAANFEQADGHRTRQYDLAVALAISIARRFPDADVEFTGHSLGGGLATIAALATQRQATVFNTAALQPTTAGLYGLETEYGNAGQHIEHIHTDYDPVTVLQERFDELDWKDLQTAPGHFTEIPNPDIPWVNAVHDNAEGFVEGLAPVIWHSMDAVIHVLESLIAFNCT